MSIEIKDVCLTIDDTPILHNISLTLSGGMVGVLGPNGAGKTTLLRVISGYLRPRQGTVRLDGGDVGALGAKALAKKMALVPQNYALEYDFTVLETVLMGRNPHKKTFESDTPEDVELARECIRKTGIGHLENRSVTGLSGGEWQRMIIARALCQESSILLLDEPVASLDIKHQVGILSLVRSLVRSRGMLCVCVLHDLNLASHYCGQVVLMKKGRVIEYGPTGDILKKDILEEVYGTKICMLRAEDGSAYILPEMP